MQMFFKQIFSNNYKENAKMHAINCAIYGKQQGKLSRKEDYQDSRNSQDCLDYRHNLAGFTLVEISISLVVIIILATAGLSIVASKAEEKRRQITIERLDFIENAIKDYFAESSTPIGLPCPAGYTNLMNQDDFGSSEGSLGNCNANNGVENLGGSSVFRGAIPFKELAISPIYMIDGWGNRFNYVIDEDVTSGNASVPSDIGIKQLDDSGGNNDIATAGSDRVIYFIFSNGANQFQAFSLKGQQRASAAGGKKGKQEEENMNDSDAIFRYEAFRTQVAGNAEYFDDIVRYNFAENF